MNIVKAIQTAGREMTSSEEAQAPVAG